MDRERIISEIRRTAEENRGVPLGAERFAETTGIGIGVWRGRYWRTWSDAVAEAGFEPNRPLEAHSREILMESLVSLTRLHQRFPTYADTRMARQGNPTFPAHQASTS